jgi:hypothetical protein
MKGIIAAKKSGVSFYSSDKRLVDGFSWAKSQALNYVFEGDLVGDWYEAALPNRAAFCMRDVSHQSTGGQVLGLSRHNKNMLLKFAQGIAESRDFCSFWEIDKLYRPAPIDYKSDEDFWYNLPANFDVLDACWRMYLWTGDETYISSSDFTRFYDLSVTKYVEKWDVNGDGMLERTKEGSYRGIASYDEGIGHSKALIMLDLIAIQARGYDSYAQLCRRRGLVKTAEKYEEEAKRLRKVIWEQWWDKSKKEFYSAKLQDGKLMHTHDRSTASMPIYYSGVIEAEQLKIELDNINSIKEINVEGMSYIPGVFYRNGQYDHAYAWLCRMVDPELKRREYPEVSFCAIGYYAEGLMGIQPYAHINTVETTPRLTEETAWARMESIPVFQGTIAVEHRNGGTCFENYTGRAIIWKARFNGYLDEIELNGIRIAAKHESGANGQTFSFVEQQIAPGEKASAYLV